MAPPKCAIPKPFQKDIKKMLMKRQKHFARGAAAKNPFSPAFQSVSDVYQEIIDNIEHLNYCDPTQIATGKGGKRKKTARNVFIGYCMKKKENGGLGVGDMKECSNRWKAEGDSLMAKYNLTVEQTPEEPKPKKATKARELPPPPPDWEGPEVAMPKVPSKTLSDIEAALDSSEP